MKTNKTTTNWSLIKFKHEETLNLINSKLAVIMVTQGLILGGILLLIVCIV